MPPSAAVQAELARRKALVDSMFPEQRDAVFDTSPLRHWQCSRRAGKTTGAMIDFHLDGRDYKNYEYAFVALTRTSAERIAWPILRKLNNSFGLGARMREAKLRVELPTASALTLYGADRPDWLDRLYGQQLRKVWIDEAAFYKIDMDYLLDDVLEPTVADLEGQITLMSKPGHVLRGKFWEIADGRCAGWSRKKWGWQQNPNMRRQVQALLDRRTALDPDYLQRPSTRRNWFNEWVSELGKRVYRFVYERNGIEAWEPDPLQPINHVLGVDLGWTDRTAFVIGAWSPAWPDWYERECFAASEMTLDRVANTIRHYLGLYPGLMVVGDAANKQAFEQLRIRYGLPIVAADKSDKRYWIEQYNTDMEAGKVHIVDPKSSTHVEEMMDLTWVERRNGELMENPTTHNDCCDAALMAFRFAHHYRYEKPVARPPVGSPEWFEERADDLEDQAEEYFEAGGFSQ